MADARAGLEGLLRRDSWLGAALLGAIVIASWAYVLSGAGMGMSAVEMTHMSGMEAMAPAAWGPAYALLMLAMWWVMMIAMMLPSAAPMILLFAAVQDRQRRSGNPHLPAGLFLASYLVT